jgi:uncharacterized protein (DUF2252 family)
VRGAPDHLQKPAHMRSRQQRSQAGKALREACSRASQAALELPPTRPDPVDLLIASSAGRIAQLVPIRYGRMLASPFAFFRGAASIMASDLAQTPDSGITVQACGDCHLMNFGAFATPERRIIFDINDFDETYPAPWEWDLKRLATSFVIASQHNGHKPADCRAAAAAVVQHYTEKLQELARQPTLSAWYAYLDYEQLIEMTEDDQLRQRRKKVLQKALAQDAAAEFVKLTDGSAALPRIKDVPPLIFHPDAWHDASFAAKVTQNLARYRDSLSADRRVLLDRYELADLAVKVVGVGSVGTLCAVALLFAAEDDPLFLQVKEARDSVLAPYVKQQDFATNGERVVFGQRLMQASSDVFLGHTVGASGMHFYVRQLRDVKVKPLVELFNPQNMVGFARNTGWALARAHARSGDAALIAGYIGRGSSFAQAIARFAVRYAAQNARDHAALLEAVRAGRVEAVAEAN